MSTRGDFGLMPVSLRPGIVVIPGKEKAAAQVYVLGKLQPRGTEAGHCSGVSADTLLSLNSESQLFKNLLKQVF